MAYGQSLRLFLRALVGLVAAGFLLAHPGSPADAAALTPQQVIQFLANPSAVLTANPDGGGKLVSEIRDLVMSDPKALPVIIGLLKSANAQQQSAIGAGLGQAALALVKTDPSLANQIQTALAASGVKPALASYAEVTGNVAIAAAGGGGGGGGGGLAPTGGGGGGGFVEGGSSTTTTGGGLTQGGNTTGASGASTPATPI